MRILYFDCFAGISGDMTIGAFLDLGVPLSQLENELGKLPLPRASYSISSEKTNRRGIMGASFQVHVEQQPSHRHYSGIARMIGESSLSERVKEQSLRIFKRLAEAEAHVHGVDIEQVHFHEVGAVDSIVDIVGAAICLEILGIEEIYASPLPLGSGYIDTAHGRLPVPAPATAELLKGMPVHGELGPGERVTPTGAAILAALCSGFGKPPLMQIEAIGHGAGSKDFEDIPNILRLVLAQKGDTILRDEIHVIETHIDDMNHEILGFLMERLFAEGALDVSFSPIQMKKNRPGVKLTTLSSPEKSEHLSRIVLTESTATGIRRHREERLKLERSVEERRTSLGRVMVKVIRDGKKVLRIAPEFEECRRLAEAKGLPLMEVYRIIERDTSP